MINFLVLKLQVYILSVHTFHTPVSHMHPDDTINSQQAIWPASVSYFFSRVIEASLICACHQTHAAQEQRAAGPMLEGPGGRCGGRRLRGVGRPSARCSGGWRGKHRSLIRSASVGREEAWECFTVLCQVPYWNSQQNNNGPVSVIEKQQQGSVFFHVSTSSSMLTSIGVS